MCVCVCVLGGGGQRRISNFTGKCLLVLVFNGYGFIVNRKLSALLKS